jgi:hypothetical protein
MSVPLLRAAIIAAVCAAFALLGGCSALRLGYGQADALAFRWLDGYVDFDDAQSLRVREGLAAWFAWNRKTQLADYAELLARVDAAVLDDTTPEQVCGWWREVRQRIDLGLEQAAPTLVDVAVTLKPAQIRNIETRYAKMNREYRDAYLQADPARRAKEAVKRVVSRAEWLYGDIDDRQRARIGQLLAESPFDPHLSLDEHLKRQQDTLQVLRRLSSGTLDAGRAQAEVRAWLERVDRSPREGYRRYAERLVQSNCRLAAEIHNSASAPQRQLATKRLRGWIGDLRALSGEG